MGSRATEPPALTLGPVLGILTVLLASILGLVLLSFAWTLGTFPGGAWANGSLLAPVGPVVALITPAALVLVVGFLIARIRWKPAPAAISWSQSSPSGSGSTVHP